jgi:hypothetical protein
MDNNELKITDYIQYLKFNSVKNTDSTLDIKMKIAEDIYYRINENSLNIANNKLNESQLFEEQLKNNDLELKLKLLNEIENNYLIKGKTIDDFNNDNLTNNINYLCEFLKNTYIEEQRLKEEDKEISQKRQKLINDNRELYKLLAQKQEQLYKSLNDEQEREYINKLNYISILKQYNN